VSLILFSNLVSIPLAERENMAPVRFCISRVSRKWRPKKRIGTKQKSTCLDLENYSQGSE
jgi:hypothetical protein